MVSRLKPSWLFSALIIALIFLVFPTLSTAQVRITKIPDLNGDGSFDLIWHNPATGQSVAWLMNGTTPLNTAAMPSDPSWKIAASADFNGDGMTDLIWSNASSGQVIEWLMNGTTVASSTLLLEDPRWKVLEAADLNADGMADLVLYNASTGQTVAWIMNGTTITRWSLLLTDPNWKVIATADFNGDRMADLIWYNEDIGQTVAWIMNGTSQPSSAVLATDPNLKVIAVADFNGDRMADIVWYNASIGRTDLWLMNGTAAVNRTTLQSDSSWKIAAIGDLNADGMADLLWNNSATGQTAAWLMSGTNVLSNVPLMTDLNWNINATADLNGDKKSDILWYNAATGQTSVWLMDGTTGTRGANLFTDPNWRLQCIQSSSMTSLLACDDALSDASTGSTPIPTNQPPVVNAGSDQSIILPSIANLSGTVIDDAIPIGLVTSIWSKVSGPGTVVFGNAAALKTTATFSAAGTYTLRLSSTDSQLSANNDIVIVVSSFTTSNSANNGNGKKNQGPVVDAGPDQTITLPATADLQGSVMDDGFPFKTVKASWSEVKGKGLVTFSNKDAVTTKAVFSSPGTYTLRLTATDGGFNRSDDVTIVVEPPSETNQAPIVNAGPDQMITLPAAANLAGTATDDGLPTGSTMTRSWNKAAGPGTVTFSDASSLNSTATFSVAGTYTLRLTASDGKSTTSDDMIVVVSGSTATNRAPIVNAGPDQTVTLPAGVTLSGTATDDGLPAASTVSVTWIKVSGPGNVVFVNVNSLNASAVMTTAGTYTLRLTASDGALSASDDVIITVNPVAQTNTAPVVNAGADQTITLPASAPLAGSATDDGLPMGSTITRSWTVFNGPGIVTFGNATALNTTAAFSAAGTYTLRLSATDSALSASDDVVITVNAALQANLPPVVNAGADQTITLPASATLAGSATDDGLPMGSTITKSWTVFNGPGIVTFGNATALNTTATFSAAGTYTLRLSATDSALSASDDVVITVNAATPVNLAPVVNAGPDFTITLPNGITLAGSATDDGQPTGSTLIKSWTKVGGPGTVTFGNAAAVNSTANFSMAGTYTLRLTASDGLLSSSDDVVFTVNAAAPPNLAPVVNAGPDFTITLPNGITLAGSATDDGQPTGSTLIKSWTKVGGPGTVTFGNAAAVNSTATFSAAGTYTLRLTASDGLLSSSDDVVFTVNAAPVNLAPVVNAGPDFTITLPNGITLAGSATDDGQPTGSTLIKSWTKVGGPGTVTFGNAAALNSTATFSAAGTYTLRLTASDGLLSSSDDVVFTVNAAAPVNLAPVVNAGPDQTITFPASAILSGAATDDGSPSATLAMTWTKVSGPGTVVFVNANSLNASATFSIPGNYTLRLSVSDGAIIAADDVNVVVNSCGNTISGAITIMANATDNVGVAGVQMKLDGADLGAFITTAPYSMPWNSTGISNGCHVISVVAQDAAGNQGVASLSTFVNNP